MALWENGGTNESGEPGGQEEKQHPRAYESWTEEEEDSLRQSLSEGKTVKQIAIELQRQIGAIRSRMNKLGLD